MNEWQDRVNARIARLEACVLALVAQIEGVELVDGCVRVKIPGPWDELRKEKKDGTVE